VIEAQERAIDELRKIITEDSKLTDTYRELAAVDLIKTNCDIPPYLSAMADSLNSQQEEISELKAVLQEEDSVKILLSNITTEMDALNEVTQATEGNQEVLGKCQELLRKQSSGLNILRTLASHTVTRKDSLRYDGQLLSPELHPLSTIASHGVQRNNSLRFSEDEEGHLVSATLCQCLPDPPDTPEPTEVTLTLVKDEDSWSPQWSAWEYDKCKTITLTNGTSIDCGEGGTKTRKRLKDLNMDVWEEEVEEVACQSCESFDDNWSTQWSAWEFDDKCKTLTLTNGTSIECGTGGSKTRKRLKDLNMDVWEEEVEEVACQSCESFDDNWSTQWSAWEYDKCETITITLTNGTSVDCGEGGTKTRKRLKDLNSEFWEEEVEEVVCQSCESFAVNTHVCLNYKDLNSPTRRSTYGLGSYCDKKISRDWKGTGWYRITGEAGTKLVDSPADKEHCGTSATGWLSGGHPTVAEGEVDRTVNFNWNGNTAAWGADVKVVNCNTHYVYYLADTPNCSLGYCTE